MIKIPQFVQNLRLEYLNTTLVKSMLSICGVKIPNIAEDVLNVLTVVKDSNPDAQTVGDLLKDVDLNEIISLISSKQMSGTEISGRSEDLIMSKNDVIKCPKCGYINKTIEFTNERSHYE